MMSFHPNRFAQKILIVFVILTCTSYLYYHQESYSTKSITLPSVGTHHAQPSKISRGYSVKPIAYVFPQYYVFEDNNRLHGENFTEWVNVKKVTHNQYGLETIRPHESFGFYNGLEYATRKRHGDFLRNNGFHGAVFHHYWFDGRPVMEHIIQAMLKDGEPNIPFMLSWANEPWSARWDGNDGSGVLIAQVYGLHEAWRKHFDWLLPFFKHPNYIRSEGRIQFIVYHPSHVGHIGPQMFAAWRQWAIEEGLGGMDIIETRWGTDRGPEQWEGYPPDALNEFQPHVGGMDHARFPATKRISRVYHRGTLACWDTSPRHGTDGRAMSQPMCHPKMWKHHLIEMFRTIKADPNPIGAENFLFINALNEWGEGNSLEPSIQFGTQYGDTMKEVVALTEKEHVWADVSMEAARARDVGMKQVMNNTADVCVLIRTNPSNNDEKPFKLSAMLRSLQAQENKNWRAAVVQTGKEELRGLDQFVVRALDPRIQRLRIPEKSGIANQTAGDAGFIETDWYIKNMTTLFPSCASAKYLLVTDGGDIYEPLAFDIAAQPQAKGDLISLHVESKRIVFDHPQLQSKSWDARCSHLESETLVLSEPPSSSMTNFDLSATFINQQRFISEGHSFSEFTAEFPNGGQVNALMSRLMSQKSWNLQPSFSATNSKVYHNPSYTSCIKSGSFWFDSPIFDEAGCYTANEFTEKYNKRVKNLKDMDLAYHRAHGLCVRYKEDTYEKAKNAPPPSPAAQTGDKKPEEKAPVDLTADEYKADDKKPAAEAKPAEHKPEEKKPAAETKTEEHKPEEKKPAAEIKTDEHAPQEKKPVAEIKTDDHAPQENKPAAEIKTDEHKPEGEKPADKDVIVLDASGVKASGPGADELKRLQQAGDAGKISSSSASASVAATASNVASSSTASAATPTASV